MMAVTCEGLNYVFRSVASEIIKAEALRVCARFYQRVVNSITKPE